MAEANNLKEVYQNVYESSKKIINKNQRNLYINTLDLITRTTNTISAKFLTDDIIKFLYTDILELVFDEDINIQNNAIIAMETILKTVDSNSFQSSVEWSPIRLNIIENYAEKLHFLRNQNNSNWYKVWCLIMRILNQEIIRSASTINIFLYVVELGFRSSDHQVRAESFKSWKVLVEIFSEHDLTSFKRIKLISIPLRSSQAKTELTALHKFKVWWFFIIKLQENGRLLETSEQTFESFLLFCFGSSAITSQLKPYFNVKEMAVISLIEMLNSAAVEIKYQMEKLELEKSSATIITEELFNKYFEVITRSVYEASIIIIEEFVTNQQKTLELLWKSLIEHVVNYDSIECYKQCFDYILLLMKTNELETKESLNQIVNSFGTNTKFLSTDTNESRLLNVEKVSTKIIHFSNLLFSSPDQYFSTNKTLISSIYGIECFSKSLKYWDLMQLILEYFLKNFRNIDLFEITNIDIKILIWEKVSQCLISYLNEKSFEFRIVSKAKILNEWVLLPIEKWLNHLNDDFIKCWNELTIAASKSEGRSNFLTAISSEIFKLNLEEAKIPYLGEIIITMIECSETRFEKSTYPKEIFMLLLKVFTNNNLLTKTFNKILDKFTSYLKQLEQRELSLSLTDLIRISKCLQKLEKSKLGLKTTIELFKKNSLNLITRHCSANQIKEYKQGLKLSDDLVIIPTVWTMDPDRLTEHQKEKMKERKNNLPALYNDMSSHSQDSYSLKSWAPNKIVISKNKDNLEIVLPGPNEVTLVQSPNAEKSSDNFVAASESDNKSPNDCKTNKDPIIGKYSDNGSELSNVEDTETNTTGSKITISKNAMKRRKSISRDDEKLLKKMNVEVDDEKTKIQLIKNLKDLEIDTVVGKVNVKKNVEGVTTRGSRKLSSSLGSSPLTLVVAKKIEKTRKSINEVNSMDIPRHTRATRSSLKQLNDIIVSKNTSKRSKNQVSNKEQTVKNKPLNLDDEIIQSSQQPSESVISRRQRRKSLGSTIVSPTKPPISVFDNKTKNLRNTQRVKPDDCNIEINSEIKLDGMVSKQSKQIAESDTEVNSESSVIMVIPSDSVKIIEISSNNLLEADTQINTERVVNETDEHYSDKLTSPKKEIQSEQLNRISPNAKSDNISHDKRRSPRKQLNFEFISVRDLNSSEEVKSLDNLKQAVQSPVFSPIKPQKTNEEKSKNSILCSPDHQSLEQTREFISNTSNISPIGDKLLDDKTEMLKKCDDLINDLTNDVDKQLSPTTRKMTGQILLSSPSDRKKTVNALSPTPKPKASTLTGRGAQLINMIRNRNSGGQTSKDGEISVKRVLETSILNHRSSPKGLDPSKSGLQANMITSTPQPSLGKDLLTLTKVLPSPYASPTASILKRKANRLSVDETELQASKRKRVGFTDPVSMTKEYALQPEEDRTLSNQFPRSASPKVLHSTNQSPSSTDQIQKHLLKRKSRVDSMKEIAKYNEDISSSPLKLRKEMTNLPTTSTPSSLQRISPVMLNDINEMENPNSKNNNVNHQYNCEEEILSTSSPRNPVTPITFSKNEDVLNYILEKYTLDDLLLKYIEKSNNTSQDLLTMKTVKTLMKEIMQSMASDEKIQTHVFETLSEKHPKEYLDHAIQENLCTVVCDRLDFNSVLNYIFEKSKINNQCYKLVLQNIYQMFKTGKYINDQYKLIQNLLKSKLQLSTEEILNCIELLIQQKNSTTECSKISNCDSSF